MAFNATKNQALAINGKGNILVSAAAGSGKTAVLVERVINLLTNSDRNIKADELLIVTFTNAAAAEMRARIEKRIDEECHQNPNCAALLMQKYLLSNAKICTIDSFCIDLVRENFDKLDISPDFRIADNATLNQINNAIVNEIINRYISENNRQFSQLVDLVGGEYDEKNLADLVLSLYEYSRQLPFPEKWYESLITSYNNGKFSQENLWYQHAFLKANDTIEEMQNILANLLDAVINLPQVNDLLFPPLNALANDLAVLKNACDSNDWDKFFNSLNLFALPSLPTIRGGNAAYREVKAVKQAFKQFSEKTLPSLAKFFYADFEFINNQFKKVYPSVLLLVDILKEFDQKVFEEYNNKNVFTFHNIEHLALKLLCCEENEQIVVSEHGKELLDQYAEVMVDEYQDTNDLQDYLFLILSNFEKRLFVVGDVKQSIYAFRGANPINFLNKKQRYLPIESATETDPQKIILANNFRTKAEVCDFINYFFKLFMTPKTGRINYDGEELLVPSAVYPNVDAIPVRFDIVDCKDTDEKTWALEGRQIANYIHEIMNEGEVIRVDENTLRAAKYGDFTILLRGLTNAPFIINELKNQGIPVDICLDAFAENREIATMLSLLKVIDNPQSDVELLTVLMSPIFSFTTDDLAEIRADKKVGSLYSAFVKAALNGNLKADEFIKKLENFRLYSVSLTLPNLISKLLIETEFLNIFSAFSDGERRKNNLFILIDLASQFLQNGKNSLSGFISYIERLSQSGAKTASVSNKNAVKIMTIHSSKGLQFPICIVAGTDSRFNDADARQATCYSISDGIGFKYYDEQFKKPFTTLSREVVIENSRNVSLEDELRLFYVALTRTQDRLLIVSSFKNFENTLEKYKNRLIMHGCQITTPFFRQSTSYSDWLIPSILLHRDGNMLREAGDMILACDDSSHIAVNVIDGAMLCEEIADNEKITPVIDDEIANKIKKNTEFIYPYKEILKVRSKTSVSALANKAESDKFAFRGKPSFMSEGGMSATSRGTAMHRVMEHFDFSNANNIEAELERLYEWQFISEEEYNSINKPALKQFFESDIFARILKADTIKREMKFLSEVPITQIDSTLDKRFENEKIVIQGAVDICFIENGEIVVLDFKTDRVNDINDLKEAYSGQLSIYAEACSKIFKMPVKEKIIYSFHLNNSISI